MPPHPPCSTIHIAVSAAFSSVDREAAALRDLREVLAGERRIELARDTATFLGSPPPRSSRMIAELSALIFARVAGSFRRFSVASRPPSCAHAGSSAAPMLVAEAV